MSEVPELKNSSFEERTRRVLHLLFNPHESISQPTFIKDYVKAKKDEPMIHSKMSKTELEGAFTLYQSRIQAHVASCLDKAISEQRINLGNLDYNDDWAALEIGGVVLGEEEEIKGNQSQRETLQAANLGRRRKALHYLHTHNACVFYFDEVGDDDLKNKLYHAMVDDWANESYLNRKLTRLEWRRKSKGTGYNPQNLR